LARYRFETRCRGVIFFLGFRKLLAVELRLLGRAKISAAALRGLQNVICRHRKP
jgi:hypothetical protein